MTSNPTNDATQTVAIIQPGQRFSHYEIVTKIGAGGMGDVYLAKDNVLARNVVLKFLSPLLASNEAFKSRFLREAKTAAALNHPNVITIHEIEESDARTYIAMEHVKGISLRDFLEEESPDPPRVLEIMAQICSGLQAAHENKIIHRDIKPDNIMITRGDFVKVLDFGLAKVTGDDKLTHIGTTIGTVNYMSPEQTEGLELDNRSDIFSLGIVLYEMLTKKPAFTRDTMPATLYAIVHETLPPLKSSIADLPKGYQNIVDKCLNKKPDKRYQNIIEMISDINELRGRSSVQQYRYQTSAPPQPAMRSLAVLCLNNLGAPEDDFLCYGISEDLIVDLTRLGAFRVSPIRSVLKFRNSEADLSEIASQLDVNFILDGSLMKMGNAVRVSAQLIEVSSNKNLWAERWEASADELPQIKTDLAKGIGQALKLDEEIINKSQSGVSKAADAAAYELYLRGKYAFDRKKDTSDVEVALGLFNQALEEEKSFLLAQLGVARIHIHKGQFEKAIAQLVESLQKAKESKSKVDIFRILLVISEAEIRLSHWDKGREFAKEAMQLAEQLGDLVGEADALRLQIDIAERRAEFNRALLLFERVMEITRKLDDQDMLAESLKSIANVHFRKGEYRRARTLYEEAIGIARRRGNVHLDAKCISNIGLTHSMTGQLDAAVDCFNKALDMYQQVGDQTGQANVYNNLALIHSSRGSYQKAIEFGRKAADLEKALINNAGYALAICNVARYLAIIGRFEEAISIAKEALKIAEELNYPFVNNLANDSLGHCYYCSGDFGKAFEHYTKAYEVSSSSNLRREMALSLSDLAKVSYYLGDIENCRKFAEQSLEIAREVGVSVATIRGTMYKAVAIAHDGDHRTAINLLESTLIDARQLGDPRFIVAGLRLLSKTIFENDPNETDRERAANYLREAATLAEQKDISYEKKRCNTAS